MMWYYLCEEVTDGTQSGDIDTDEKANEMLIAMFVHTSHRRR